MIVIFKEPDCIKQLKLSKRQYAAGVRTEQHKIARSISRELMIVGDTVCEQFESTVELSFFS
jgi:hypothetical protein